MNAVDWQYYDDLVANGYDEGRAYWLASHLLPSSDTDETAGAGSAGRARPGEEEGRQDA